MMNIFGTYNNCYSVTKTMRFSLIPQFDTEKILNLIEADEDRKKKYQEVKPIIDTLHRNFIEKTMSAYHKCEAKYKCDWQALADAISAIKKDSSKQNRTNLLNIQKEYQKNIEKYLKNSQNSKNNPNGAELKVADIIKKIKGSASAFDGILSKEEIAKIAEFKNFSTYFENFEKTRENIYKAGISNSVPYRVVVDNFGKFYSNILLFNRLDETVKAEISEWYDANIFAVEKYDLFLVQTTIDAYNSMIGDINKLCNEKFQNKLLPYKVKFTTLFKQILTVSDKLFNIESFSNKEELLQAVIAYKNLVKETIDNDFGELKQIFTDASVNTDKIFIDKNKITQLSKLIFSEWDKIKINLKESDYYTIAQIQAEFDNANIMELFATKLEEAINEISEKAENIPSILEDDYEAIKDYMDSVQRAEKILKYVASDKAEKDDIFYSYFDAFYEVLRSNIPLYNKIRNFATKKQYSTEKVKLYFDVKNGNFLNGWVESKTEKSDNGTQYGGYLFRKKNEIDEYDYYLGVSNNAKLFRHETGITPDDASEFERYNYYQPKAQTVYGAAYKGKNTYNDDKSNLLAAIKSFINQKDEKTLQDEFENIFSDDNTTPTKCVDTLKSKYPYVLSDLMQDAEFSRLNQLVIDNIKATVESMDRLKNTELITEKDYTLFTEIMADVDTVIISQRIRSYDHVSKSELEKAINDTKKPLLLFKISNKDLSYAETFAKGKRKSRGAENLHTLYFRELMDADSPTVDIGSGSVFFRKKTLEYSDEILEKGHHYNQLKDKFSYPIIKDKRYAFDQFQFHLSAMFNFEKPTKPKDFNKNVLETLQNTEDYNIIGIDRGERHLLYISVIDRHGKILHQETLNEINGVDYHGKLMELEKLRKTEKVNWHAISKIKDLKAGYISYAVRKIVDLMLEYNAVVAMEDLSYEFKRTRIHIERQVYQNFEKALIEKLNFLMLKDRDKDKLGGIRKAYQLTDTFESFQKLDKQSGFLFYVPPANTSKIDPVSGFVNLFNSKHYSYSSRVKAREFISTFDNISYDERTESFRFDFDYRKFNTNRKDFTNKWSIYSYGDGRVVFTKKNNQQSSEIINVTEQLKELFNQNGIDYRSATLKEDICEIDKEAFFKKFLWLFKVIVQLRYENKETDFILSPVMVDGKFFDSRNAEKTLPQNGDANGAYHIALQCLRLLTQQVKNGKITSDAKGKQALNWFTFVQKKPFAE